MSPQDAARATDPQQRSSRTRERTGQTRPPLSVVDRKALALRRRQRRERILFVASGLVLAASLGIVAAAQGAVTSQQEHLDVLNQQVASAVARTQSLELSRAQLAAPSRILAIAEKRLHMVAPTHVTYLVPVAPAGGVSAPHRRSAR